MTETEHAAAASLPCRPRIVDAGFPNRGAVILARDRALFDVHAADVRRWSAVIPQSKPTPGSGRSTGIRHTTGGEPGVQIIGAAASVAPRTEPTAVTEPTFAQVESMLDAMDGVRSVPAAFVAGRCECTDLTAETLAAELKAIVAAYNPATPDTRALLTVHAAMSLALLGDVTAMDTLKPRVQLDAQRSTVDWLAAYHLAQVGDPAGYPLLVQLMRHKIGHYRLMAARHLVAFVPYEATTIGGEFVDVVGRLADLIDDKDDEVSGEIPGLMAEADPQRARSILVTASKSAKHKSTRAAAAWTVERIDAGGS